MDLNFTDLYILYNGHPNYSSVEMIEDDIVRVIIQKYQMVIFTNQGDVWGMPNFGANLLELLHDTKFSSDDVRKEIEEQIALWIPELSNLDYTLKVNFYDHPERFEEIMVVDLSFNGYDVSAVIQ